MSIQWVVHFGGVSFGIKAFGERWRVCFKTSTRFGWQGGYYTTSVEAEQAACRYATL